MDIGLYHWLKALHIIAVVAWMAGLLYLPRLFVYHVNATAGSEASEMLKVMERRLMRFIMLPASIATWVFGLGLLHYFSLAEEPWLHSKLGLVLVLTGFHHFCARWRKDFARDANRHTAKFFRIMNEVPTLLMVGIVLLVVLKPF
ncbi:MAG: protoporphyrinogen oxidase HemJ [Alphaproteobacteria bacterium]|nr:protoporphyrinogen oxidase HemJ [Alphaproteobacteria bacterium]